MNNLRKQVNASPFKNHKFDHIFAAILYGLMVVAELKTPPETVISPLITMMSLGILACIMRPGGVAAWGIIFLPTTFYFLFHISRSLSPNDVTTAWIRFGTIFMGAVGAVFLSCERRQFSERYLQLLCILEKLPVPVIISDNKGCVVFMNNGATELLNTTAKEAQGASYFSYVASAKKGHTVQKYFDFLDSKESILHKVLLNIKKPRRMTGMATMVAIQGSREKYVATVISTDDKPLPEDGGVLPQ